MARVAQIGIAIGALGVMLMLMALFPGVTGLAPTPGLGVVQIFGFLAGFSWLIFGALFYVKYAFYATEKSNLSQQIGVRLALTGLVLAVLSGLPDALGFGSHGAGTEDESYFGPLQAIGVLASYAVSCFGVLVYALAGTPPSIDAPEDVVPDEKPGADDDSDQES